MTRLRLAAGGAALLLALGCTKSVGPPSPQFQQARDRYIALLQKDGPLDIFTDEQLPAVRAQLDNVPADSVDADAAAAMRKTIDTGIAEARKADQAGKAALAAPSGVATAPILPQAAAPTAPVPTAPAPDALPPLAGGPSAGMATAEFLQKFGTCFTRNSAFTDDQGAQGEAYGMVGDAACGKKYGAYANQLVLVSGAKVLRLVPTAAVTSRSSFTLNSGPPAPSAPAPAPAPSAPPAAPVPAGRSDDKITGPDDRVQAPANQNAEVDARSKLPGSP
jgi:hypothetical protein